MSNSIRKASTTVFVLGIVVSFSSLLFMVLFYNFSVIPSIPIIISVLVCAGFQLAAYLGGAVFEKRIWPAILYMLVCSVGTAWAGAVGPGALFGMPGTLIFNIDKTISNPMYLASLPVTIVGFATGMAYFVLGVTSLLYDSHMIRKEREDFSVKDAKPAVVEEPVDKAAIYAQVTDQLSADEEKPAEEAIEEAQEEPAADMPEENAPEAAEEADENAEDMEEAPVEEPELAEAEAAVETASESVEEVIEAAEEIEDVVEEEDDPEPEADAPDAEVDPEAVEDVTLPEEETADAEDSAAKEPADEETEPAAEEPGEEIEELIDEDIETDLLPELAGNLEGGSVESGELKEDDTKTHEKVLPNVASTASSANKPSGSIFSRLAGKISSFFAAEQPVDTPEAKPEEATPTAESAATEILGPALEVPEALEDESAGDVLTPADDDEKKPEKAAEETVEDDSESAEAEDDALVGAAREDVTGGEPDDVETDPAEVSASSDDAEEPEDSIEASDADEEQDDAETEGEEASPSDDQEPPPLVTLRRSELLADWEDTPYIPVPAEDLSVTLETDRLRLVRLDRPAFAALLRGIEEMEEATGLTPSGEQLDSHALDTFDELYTRALGEPGSYKWFAVWIISSKAENKLLGSAGFKGKPNDEGEVELGFGLNETRRGNDYASEAAVALCQWALLQKDVRAVNAETGLANLESESLVEEAGMKRVKKTSTSSVWRLEK